MSEIADCFYSVMCTFMNPMALPRTKQDSYTDIDLRSYLQSVCEINMHHPYMLTRQLCGFWFSPKLSLSNVDGSYIILWCRHQLYQWHLHYILLCQHTFSSIPIYVNYSYYIRQMNECSSASYAHSPNILLKCLYIPYLAVTFDLSNLCQ